MKLEIKNMEYNGTQCRHLVMGSTCIQGCPVVNVNSFSRDSFITHDSLMFKYTPAGLALTQLLYSKAYALCLGKFIQSVFIRIVYRFLFYYHTVIQFTRLIIYMSCYIWISAFFYYIFSIHVSPFQMVKTQ